MRRLVLVCLLASVAAAPAAAPPAVPILVFHNITRLRLSSGDPALGYHRFQTQMLRLRQSGFQAITLGRLFDAWHQHPDAHLPPRPVVLTFDDGYRSQIAIARQVLRRYHWPGVLNLVTSRLAGARGVTMKQLRTVIGDGWEIDGHTATHPDLTHVGRHRLWREVNRARHRLRQALHVPVKFFAYPYGRYDARVEHAVKAAGYRGAMTTTGGLASPFGDPFALPRIGVGVHTLPLALVHDIKFRLGL